MKVEIGESLVSSYLNHVEQCRIIETNWKISRNWSMDEHDKSRSKDLKKYPNMKFNLENTDKKIIL